jgi:hypothetical protein
MDSILEQSHQFYLSFIASSSSRILSSCSFAAARALWSGIWMLSAIPFAALSVILSIAPFSVSASLPEEHATKSEAERSSIKHMENIFFMEALLLSVD